jgi:hypothetical protein
MRAVFLVTLVALSVVITACDQRNRSVRGTCSEDHVRQSDNYAGQIVRWQAIDTGKIDTYGFVFKEGDVTKQIFDEVAQPHVYHTPNSISLLEIDIDTDQPKWVLHGVSDRGKDASDDGEDALDNLDSGYNSTCDLEVVKRGMEIHLPGMPQGATPPHG